MGEANLAHYAAGGLDAREATGLPSRDLEETTKHGLRGKVSVATGRSEKARRGWFVGALVRADGQFGIVSDAGKQSQRRVPVAERRRSG